MKCMGFGPKWITFIQACLSSSSISVLINGSPTAEFSPERGIRQGDPISPFLFIIAAKGLNILAKRSITNDQFCVYLKKSNLYGIGVPYNDVEEMANYIDFSSGSTPFTYLSLPIGVPTTKASSWQPIIEKFDKRLSDWKAKSMSYGGRLV
ncbi:uncharacterized protein [Rutidosis leptorrhynchoides]|uniref:uncharacterized protein n=1 Tax=Rutidosis leptorrhynchoides TaxID=125765 RepID=UPI003A991014